MSRSTTENRAIYNELQNDDWIVNLKSVTVTTQDLLVEFVLFTALSEVQLSEEKDHITYSHGAGL
jgi:hypothetical protein